MAAVRRRFHRAELRAGSGAGAGVRRPARLVARGRSGKLDQRGPAGDHAGRSAAPRSWPASREAQCGGAGPALHPRRQRERVAVAEGGAMARVAKRADPDRHHHRFHGRRLLAGAVVVESVFVWPGLGRLLVVAVGNRDLAVVQCILLLVAVTMVSANLLVDLLYGWLDPRILTEQSGRGR